MPHTHLPLPLPRGRHRGELDDQRVGVAVEQLHVGERQLHLPGLELGPAMTTTTRRARLRQRHKVPEHPGVEREVEAGGRGVFMLPAPPELAENLREPACTCGLG